MDLPHLDYRALGSLLLAALPLPYLVAALVARSGRENVAWRGAFVAAAAVACGAVAVLLASAAQDDTDQRLRATVVSLVAFVASIIVRFSRTYLSGEPRQPGYVAALMLVLGAVAIVVTTNDLLVLAVAWTGASLALHRLLTFYPERRPAQIAAHKKFIVSRLADVCLFAAVLSFAHAFDTLKIDTLLQRAADAGPLPLPARVAVVLVALTALLRCAQLPFHGWLIQVMEAPTPVSALLHAGVVNLGGFVLIRLGALVAAEPAAQWLLVGVGAATAVIAALVATTRISIKVALAWSTCAQMGFMLMQCGLGAYDLALLHLLAHSLYKAHAFLASGSVVAQTRARTMAPPPANATVFGSTLAALSVVAVLGGGWAALAAFGHSTTPHVVSAPALVVALALAQWLALPAVRERPARALGVAIGIGAVWLALHSALGAWIGAPLAATRAPTVLVAVAASAFVALYAVQAVVAARPSSAFARALYPLFYAGLYLDELMTRASFRVWPVRAGTVQRPAVVS